jgi:hypothetical protein
MGKINIRAQVTDGVDDAVHLVSHDLARRPPAGLARIPAQIRAADTCCHHANADFDGPRHSLWRLRQHKVAEVLQEQSCHRPPFMT